MDQPESPEAAEHLVDVVAVGSPIVDIVWETTDENVAALGRVKGTMALVDEEAAARLYEAMGPSVEMSGGSAANTAVGVASFGGTAAFIGRVRDDQLGQVFVHDIRAAGVGFDTRPAVTGPATGRCLILVTPDAQRTLTTYLGAAAAIEPDDLDAELVAESAVVYLEGYLWDPPKAKDALRRAIALARSAHTRVALSLSDPLCVDRHRDEFLGLIETGIDLLFANETEIISLFEAPTFEVAAKAIRPRCPVAALTRAELGSVVVTGDEMHVVAAAPVEQVVDTTGAGDLYAAGFLYGFTHGADPSRCAQLGGLAAGEVIGHLGARPLVGLQALAEQAGLLPLADPPAASQPRPRP